MLSFNLSQLNEGALVESCDPVMLVVWFDGVFVVVVVICVMRCGARVLASCAQEALFRNVRCAQCHSLKALPVLNTNRVLFSIHISI